MLHVSGSSQMSPGEFRGYLANHMETAPNGPTPAQIKTRSQHLKQSACLMTRVCIWESGPVAAGDGDANIVSVAGSNASHRACTPGFYPVSSYSNKKFRVPGRRSVNPPPLGGG